MGRKFPVECHVGKFFSALRVFFADEQKNLAMFIAKNLQETLLCIVLIFAPVGFC